MREGKKKTQKLGEGRNKKREVDGITGDFALAQMCVNVRTYTVLAQAAQFHKQANVRCAAWVWI